MEPTPASPEQRMTLGRWSRINLSIGLLSFGGGNRLLLYRDQVVGPSLSKEAFDDIVVSSQIAPGPNLVNAVALLGYHLLGWRGCLVGLISLVAPSAVLATIALTQLDNAGIGVAKFMHGAALAGVGIVAAETLGFARRMLQTAALKHRGGYITVSLASSAVVIAAFAGTPLSALLVAGIALGCLPKAKVAP